MKEKAYNCSNTIIVIITITLSDKLLLLPAEEDFWILNLLELPDAHL